MNNKLNAILNAQGISVGLTNDKHNTGTWEWFEKSTGEFRNGFATEQEAYTAAAAHVKDTTGEDLPALNEDGELVGA